MNRGSGPQRKTPRNTDPTDAVLKLVKDRATVDDRVMCEMCGERESESTHHRQARGMGGSRDLRINLPANLVRTCGDGTRLCHGEVESRRTWAKDRGWVLSKLGDPARIPSEPILRRGEWVQLDNDGGVTPCDPPNTHVAGCPVWTSDDPDDCDCREAS